MACRQSDKSDQDIEGRTQGGISNIAFRAEALVFLVLVTACNPQRTQELYGRLEGPGPELDSSEIEGFVGRQTKAIEKLVALAGLDGKPKPGEADWKAVVDAGTLYVDKVCEEYIEALFWFDRWRDSAKSGVALTGASASAAMGILGAAASAIALTATGFGLTTALIDVGANTVLYSIEPSAVRSALGKSQTAYRDTLANRRDLYDNQAAVLAAVQGYLALCLPATLETTVNTAVAQANIGEIGTEPDNPVPSVRVLDVRAPLPQMPPLPPEQQISNHRSSAEQALSRGQGGLIQEALCVRPDGNFGNDTREAIALYRRARDSGLRADDSRLQAGLSQREIVALLGAGSCASLLGYRTAYERFAFPTEESVRVLQAQISAIRGEPALAPTGRFDEATRAAIREVNQKLQLGDADTVTPELMDKMAE